ncbi:ABC transporter ATP-binding protein [Deinococcus maricopensis]|uniref:ABC transporter related protein n=1 Tax=Deinococcus maricopensis (strain DSM 21211 / LMG 22137 / NRRL B-23946 / LB-34) TaxID=709986 RepID=E8UBE2_DEIML|nr:ABC transporter ATP-binding protein [Deinococcus maricopensis]ADV68381.1 ABC transporter related protein [Deinococcus maricopensis DSM 21211]
MNDVLTVSHLTKRYGRVHALRDLTLTVGRGQIYGFLGPNGAGKTTAIRAMLGLTRPNSGTVRLFGEPLHRAALARVGALVEAPSAYPHLTGRENLEVTRRLRGADARELPEVLALVGLTDAADRPVRGYSLGMRGRLSIAAALLGRPEFLLLDEPTNGLDPQGIREVRDLIRALPERGLTVMLSSHLLAEIEQVATHVGIVADGTTRFEGTLADLRAQAHPELRVTTDQPSEAAVHLAQLGHAARVDGADVVLPDPRVSADVNEALVRAGHRVSRLAATTHTLEELFLNLVRAPEARAC